MMQRIFLKNIFLTATTLALAACQMQSNPKNPANQAAQAGKLELSQNKINAEEAGYTWKYPEYPAQYKINPLDNAARGGTFMSGRALAEGGSYAGPWLEGEESRMLPVANPNVNVGDAIVAGLGDKLTTELLPTINESPFQAFLKLREGVQKLGLSALKVNLIDNTGKTFEQELQLDKEALWSLTFALYRKIEPDYKKGIEMSLDPASKGCETADINKCYDGKKLFGSNCSMCHGADGWGRGHSGHKLQPPPANFHEPRRLYNRSEAQLRTALKNGVYGSGMPQWGDKLSERELAHVAAFVRSFSYSSEAPVNPNAGAEGQK